MGIEIYVKKKKECGTYIAVAMSFSILHAKVIKAAGFTRNESKSCLKKLDLVRIYT